MFKLSNSLNQQWTVLDLFSGAGGMSYGFHAHPGFKIVGAVDAQIGKPSDRHGSLQCNLTYHANIGIEPLQTDLSTISPHALRKALQPSLGSANPTVLIACPPCTGFSRTIPHNHLRDDPRNLLVEHSTLLVEEFRPQIFLMENARELIRGKFKYHYHRLCQKLNGLGYKVQGQIELFNRFGLPQRRERAIAIAVQKPLNLRTLEDLWSGYQVRSSATHVRRAISNFPALQSGQTHPEDPLHTSPSFAQPQSLERLKLIPKNGGSWADLRNHPLAEDILTPAMLNYISKGQFGSHPDVYGRLWWDRPAATIKRECSHIGNGRYAHPEQDRLCTVRELSILQGFPRNYQFIASNKSNLYRQIGDAVPPLISYQLAKVCEWILSGIKPSLESCILPNTHLTVMDLKVLPSSQLELALSY
jgi:DNA (cytosine-5)-methyltransferase 1